MAGSGEDLGVYLPRLARGLATIRCTAQASVDLKLLAGAQRFQKPVHLPEQALGVERFHGNILEENNLRTDPVHREISTAGGDAKRLDLQQALKEILEGIRSGIEAE